jgi:hypothetical protein
MKYNHGNNNPILDAYKTFEWKSTPLTRMQARWYLALLAISILLCNASTVLAVDTDGDGVDDDLDTFPFDSSQQLDSDFDGFGDSPVGNNSDDCPLEYGTSLTDNLGCVDDDGDGIRNADDQFPFDDQQWLDRDGDGFGDNLVKMAMLVLMNQIMAIMAVLKCSKQRLKNSKVRPEHQSLTSQF